MNWQEYLYLLKQCLYATLILMLIYAGFEVFIWLAPESLIDAITSSGPPSQPDMSPDYPCNGC